MSVSQMRLAYADTLDRLMTEDDRIVVVEADLSRSLGSQPLAARHPGRFFDLGIAEQNLVAVASGLAIGSDLIPFAHTFAPFMSRRAFDQITVSVGFAQANVKLVGSDPGLSAEINGATHMCFEDIAALRAVPGLSIVEAADAYQLAALLPVIARYVGPVYLRLFRKDLPALYAPDCRFTLGQADVLRPGTDCTLVGSGIMVYYALEAAKLLENRGISARVLNLATIKPLDEAAILAAARETGALVTCENHNVLGGLGAAVCEVVCAHCPVPVQRIGIPNRFGEVGRLAYLLEVMGMTPEHIAAAAERAIAAKV